MYRRKIMSLDNNKSLPHMLKYKCVYQAIIELQYKSTMPVELLAVKLSDSLSSEYNVPYRTPVQDVPQIVRQNTPGLEKAICYYIKSKHDIFNIGIGQGIISLQIINFSYRTWNVFINEFKKIYEKINSYINTSERIGVRYINVFDSNVLTNLNIDLNVYKESILKQPLVLTWQNEENKHIIKTSLINKAVINYNDLQTGEPKVISDASIVDIDCIFSDLNGQSINLLDAINENHNIVKRHFFGLFSEDYIKNVLIPVEEDE